MNINAANTSLFSKIPEPVLQELLAASSHKDLAAGQVLFQQGDPADALYVLNSGTLEVGTMSADGKKLSLNILRPGELFGEIALGEDGIRSATVTALEASSLSRLARDQLFSLIRTQPDLAVELLKLVINRFQWVSAQLETFTFMPLNKRLARRIILLGRKMPSPHGTLHFSQSELAEHTGATREAVAKILAEWKKLGIIETGRGNITILDPAGLENLAE